ncbi:MAG: tetratricopeptide repeat protein [Pseudomonadota bacterium]
MNKVFFSNILTCALMLLLPLNTLETFRYDIRIIHSLVMFLVCSLVPVYADYINGETLFTEQHPAKTYLPDNIQQTLKISQTKKVKSIDELKQSAKNGFAAAQHALAIHYLTNNKTELKKAVYWLEKSAEQNNIDALRDLAYLYYQGQGVKKDLQQAKMLLKKPVQHGNTFAQQLFIKIEQEIAIREDKYFHNSQNWYNIANQPDLIKKPRTAKELVKTTDFISTSVFAWKQAWQDQDIKRYLNFYSKNFKYHKGNYNHWKKYRRRIFNSASNIQLSITNITIKKKALQRVVSFNQYYQSDSYTDKVYKEQYWQLEADAKWRIIAEKTIIKQVNKNTL